MSTEQELLEIEHTLATGGGDEYRDHLTDDAVVIIPGQALDKTETIGAMEQSPGWDEVKISDPRALEVGDRGAVLTYRFDGRRGDDYAYAALMSSAYTRVDGGWKLVLHQQTPLQGS
ncbi:MAG: nuclear transport factor 2 family protein [Solirubrobacterales bacterium]